MKEPRDPALDALLLLDGEIFFADADGRYFVKFSVKRVEPSAERPHGLSYSLTLHSASGDRLVGFDNAHPVSSQRGPAGRKKRTYDHRHRFKTIINLFPEETSQRSRLLPDEERFVREHGIRYLRSPSNLLDSDEFLDEKRLEGET